jgi:ABC-2 type transport system ATP-binding protein
VSPKVSVRDLKKRYDSVEAARGVSFEILDGEIFGLIGQNGAGKTTTVECVLGLREPDEGAIEVCGIDARRHPRAVKEKIGAALQTTALQEKITPREALSLFGAFYRHRAEPAALLERFSLLDKADEPFDTLSGGQRQRLALALAFVNQPELVFLDEPTAGLDPQARRELHGEIAKMRDEGHTVLLTTHYLNEAEALCDRIAIIDHGRIIVTGTPQEIIARSSAAMSVRLTTAQKLDREWLEKIAGVEGLTTDDTRVSFRASAGSGRVNATVAAVLSELDMRGVEVAELHLSKATLEDVFLELTALSSQPSA